MSEKPGSSRAQVASVLDIGDGVGALVVHTGVRQAGAELHVVPLDPAGTRTHAVVCQRPSGSTGYAALLPALAPGRYRVTAGLETMDVEVEVAAGTVTEVTLRTP